MAEGRTGLSGCCLVAWGAEMKEEGAIEDLVDDPPAWYMLNGRRFSWEGAAGEEGAGAGAGSGVAMETSLVVVVVEGVVVILMASGLPPFAAVSLATAPPAAGVSLVTPAAAAFSFSFLVSPLQLVKTTSDRAISSASSFFIDDHPFRKDVQTDPHDSLKKRSAVAPPCGTDSHHTADSRQDRSQ